MANKPDITRRDFLNGVALSLAAGTTLSPLDLIAAVNAKTGGYYPPALTGLRGSHTGSFEIAHAVAMAGANFGRPRLQTDSTYDLVVVGGGISGLAAAKLYRDRAGAGKKVLVLDNHDDFGGHAKRNEFDVNGKHMISYGGSQSLESPSLYSRQAKQLLASLGIEPQRFYRYFDQEYFSRRGLQPAIHFSRKMYGEDKTLPNVFDDGIREQPPQHVQGIVATYPLSDASKAGLLRLIYEDKDYLDGRSERAKVELLRSMSYSDFLRNHVGVSEEVVNVIRDSRKSYWGIGWDALSALEAYRLEQPGTYNLGISSDKNPSWAGDEPYIFHFPDGNASVARALVRALLPKGVPGSTMEDLVTAELDYSMLDQSSATSRIRLNTTVVDVRHSNKASYVDVTYIRNGAPERVRGRHAILACYNSVIPHICAELPLEQRAAIESATKTPLAYINIAIRNWRAFAELGCRSIYVPQAELMHSISLDFPVSMGSYSYSAGPDEPMVLHGVFAPTSPDRGLDMKQQFVAGKKRMLEMSFDDYESRIIAQLDGALASGGFDAERDIEAITVNRWPHGYAYEYNDLFDPAEYGPERGPHVAGRARIGRISIANSDSQARAYVDGAIDAAYRAVAEQLIAA